jgi:hypothetical protein
MSEAMIGALRAVLGIDTVAFSKGLKDAEKSLGGFGASFASVAKKLAIPAAVVAGLGGIAAGIKKAIDAADEMGKMSEKFGVPVEQLSRLKYAAELNEVSFETLGKGLRNFGIITQEALAKPSGDAAKKLAVLGITIDDIRNKTPEDLFKKAADGTTKLADGFGKVNAVSDAFGKRIGTDLIPLLNKGSKGIAEAGAEAEKLGLVISTKTALAADKFNDEMQAIGKFAPGVFQRVAAAALPALTALATQFKTAGLEGGFLEAAVKEVTKFVLEAIYEFNKLAYIIGQVAEAWQALQLQFKQQRTAEEVKDSNERIAQSLKNIWNAGKEVKEQMAFDEMLHEIEMVGLMMDRWVASMGKGGNATREVSDQVAKFIENTKKAQALQAIDIANTNSAIGVKEKLHIIEQGRQEAILAGRALTAQEKADIDALGTAAANYAVQLAKIRLEKENLTAEEKYMEKLKEINQLEQGNARDREIAHRARIKNELEYSNTIGESLAKSAGQFAEFFNAFAGGSKEMFLIGKALAISQATIQAYLAFTNALANTLLPPPFPQIAAAAALAAGLGAVAKIVAQKQPTKAALGGSFRVPGGASGVDTKLVRMQLAPGERVDVTPAGRAGGDRNLIIPAIRPKDFFTGEVVREMVLSLDQWLRDGGTGIKLAGASR